jgi:hypothetical protein
MQNIIKRIYKLLFFKSEQQLPKISIQLVMPQ